MADTNLLAPAETSFDMSVQIPIAKDGDNWIFPEDTTRRHGFVYECLDRDCKVHLIPVRGDEKAWHFRHKKENPDCTLTGESLEHLRGKVILYKILNRAISDQEFKLSIKLLCHGCNRQHRVQEDIHGKGNCKGGTDLKYSGCNHMHEKPFKLYGKNYAVFMEYTVTTSKKDNIRADVALIRSEGKPILFEVCVTNPVDEDKKRKLDNAKTPWVEIKAEELPEDTTTITPFNSSRLTWRTKNECPNFTASIPDTPP